MITFDVATNRWVDTRTGQFYDPRDPQSSTLTPSPAIREAMDRAAFGDAEAMGVVFAAVEAYNASEAPTPTVADRILQMLGPNTLTPGGQTPVGMATDEYTSLNNQLTQVLHARQGDKTLDQQEHDLRQTMREAGQDPDWWFNLYQRVQTVLPDSGGDTEQAAVYGRQSPAFRNAMTSLAGTAAAGQQQARAEQLQAVKNAFSTHMEGATWLQKYGDLNRQIRDAQSGLDYAELVASSKAANDRQLVPGRDGRWYHGGLGSEAERIRDMQRQADELNRQRYPDQQAAVDRQRLADPSTRAYQLPHVLAAAGLDPTESQYPGGYPPRYAEGGTVGGEPVSGMEPGIAMGGDAAADPQQDNEDAATLAIEDRDYQTAVAELEQQFELERQRLDQDHAQTMAQLAEDNARREAVYGQRAAALQQELTRVQQLTGVYGMAQGAPVYAG